jgi:hypothetical protein
MGEEEGFRGEEVYATLDQRLQGSEEFIGGILEEHSGDGMNRGIRRRAYSLLQISKALEAICGLKIEDLRSTRKTGECYWGGGYSV